MAQAMMMGKGMPANETKSYLSGSAGKRPHSRGWGKERGRHVRGQLSSSDFIPILEIFQNLAPGCVFHVRAQFCNTFIKYSKTEHVHSSGPNLRSCYQYGRVPDPASKRPEYGTVPLYTDAVVGLYFHVGLAPYC